jgi:hypothetical protein
MKKGPESSSRSKKVSMKKVSMKKVPSDSAEPGGTFFSGLEQPFRA